MLITFNFSIGSQAQNDSPIPFRHRVGQSAPEGNIYRIKGDFTMIGNSNLRMLNYTDSSHNSLDQAIYIDIDNDPSTFNSSSATLVFSEENDADPNCSEIRYAGLYWSGRTILGSGVNFDITKNTIPGETKTFINEEVILSGLDDDQNEYLGLSILKFVDETGEVNTISFSVLDSLGNFIIAFLFENGSSVKYSIDGNNYNDVENLELATEDGVITATFDSIHMIRDELTFSFGKLSIEEKYESASTNSENTLVHIVFNGSHTFFLPFTNSLDKRKVKLKGPNSSNYTEIIADGNALLFPQEAYAEIFVGYADITDYVKQQGLGEYTVADIALHESYSDQTGFFGSWGIIVIYQNSKMSWRDITIFDGYSFVEAKNGQENTLELEISGFGTVNSGPVALKLGLMAGEGDRPTGGDFFEIIDQKGDWVRLSHPKNTPDNFFNSTIYTPVKNSLNQLVPTPRYPNLINNVGVDIVQWDIENPDNSILTNNQTSTRFRFGTRQDLYTIYNLAFSVLSYIPEIQVLNQVSQINGTTVSTDPAVAPGDEITYTAEIRNLGTEEVKDGKITIPLPYTTTFVSATTIPSNYGSVIFDPSMGVNGTIIWEIGEIPLPESSNDIIATLVYTVKVTEDCSILTLASCESNVTMEGFVSGIGKNSGNEFTNLPFVYEIKEGLCEGEEINTPLKIPIINRAEFVAANCPEFNDFSGINTTDLPVFCLGDVPIDLINLIKPSNPHSQIYFYTQEIGGTPLKNYLVNTYMVGLTTIWAAQGLDSECTGPRVPLKIEVIAKSPAPHVENRMICLGTSEAGFQITQHDGYELNYYLDDSPLSSPLGSIPSIDPTKPGLYHIWVSQFKDGECESDRVKAETRVYDCNLVPSISIEIEPDIKLYTYEGQIITFTITVSNTGGIPLTNIRVPEDLTGNEWTIPELLPGESRSFTFTYPISLYDAHTTSVQASASANGMSFLGNVFSYNYTVIYRLPDYFKDYQVTTIFAKCIPNQNNTGTLIIKFSEINVTGHIELFEDGKSVYKSYFDPTDELRVEIKPGNYQIGFSTFYGLEIISTDIYTIEGPATARFELVEDDVYACTAYTLLPLSEESLIYDVFDPTGSIIPQESSGGYLLTLSGKYRVIGKDPEGVKCSVEKSMQVTIPAVDTIDLIIGSFCQNDYFTTVEITETTLGDQIQWSSQSTDGWVPMTAFDEQRTIELTEPGTYLVTKTNPSGCIVGRREFIVARTQQSPPNMAALYTICPTKQGSQTISISNQFKDHVWFFEDKVISEDAQVRPTEAGRYTLLAADMTGCAFSVEFDVEITCEPTLIYSNAIKLGAENQGLILYPDNLIGSISIQVFNRWGELIYSCLDSSPTNRAPSLCFWDGTVNGKDAITGSYSLLIKYTLKGEDKIHTIRDMIMVLQ
ncbi:DUF7507 domain-containing protein [Mongoliitalea daihaiensis]|uniref:DUF7507 domain-containing protein n=1 Tax=Mongoliitalea daihaiensis TaxID=2782006 RepID=UPI001F35003B|nr:hypothetical protein [Mongoliitalea daihaiensis]UJP64655.1 hypothetical protein IPZ59_17920 [Mongoliitalea daihaiensis]